MSKLDRATASAGDRIVWLDEQMVEVFLILPGRQAAELERRAWSRGWTLGQLIRLLIRNISRT
jgi:hypothetical protein